MLSIIWSGAGSASDTFFLIAAILAGVATLLHLVHAPAASAEGDTRSIATWPWATIFLNAAVCLIALGLLAV